MNTRLVVVCLVSSAVTALTIATLRTAARHVGLVDHPSARKQHGEAVPLLGGICILLGVMIGTLMLPIAWGSPPPRAFVAALMIIGLAGVLDDLHEISPSVKLVFQISCACVMMFWAGLTIQSLGMLWGTVPTLTGGWAVPFTLLAVVGLMNAVNMTDGIDGLVGTCAAMTFGFMILVCVDNERAIQYGSTLYILLSTILAFLIFNLPYPGRPLRTFLGDTGSLVIGFIVAWFSVMLSQAPVSAAPPVLFVWFCGLYLLDFLCIIAGRTLRGKSPLHADRRHLHHLLLRSGLSHRQTLVVLATIHFSLCSLGYLLWKSGVSEPRMLAFAFLILFGILLLSLNAKFWVIPVRRWLLSS